MTSDTVNTLADYLAAVDADWRKVSGYTGRAVHKRAYWQNMAARLIADSVKALAKPKKKSISNDQSNGKALASLTSKSCL